MRCPLWSLPDMAGWPTNVRFNPDCVAKLGTNHAPRNDRIGETGLLIHCSTLARADKSILRSPALKIVLQHNHPESGHKIKPAASNT